MTTILMFYTVVVVVLSYDTLCCSLAKYMFANVLNFEHVAKLPANPRVRRLVYCCDEHRSSQSVDRRVPLVVFGWVAKKKCTGGSLPEQMSVPTHTFAAGFRRLLLQPVELTAQ